MSNQTKNQTEDERLWRWFYRIHETKTGRKLTEESKKDPIWATCFEWWISGYKCRQIDEAEEKHEVHHD